MVPWLPSIQTSSDFASGGGMYCTCIILNHSKSIPHPQVPRPSTSPRACNEVLNILALRFANRELGRLFMHLGQALNTKLQAMWVTDLMFKPNPLVQRQFWLCYQVYLQGEWPNFVNGWREWAAGADSVKSAWGYNMDSGCQSDLVFRQKSEPRVGCLRLSKPSASRGWQCGHCANHIQGRHQCTPD